MQRVVRLYPVDLDKIVDVFFLIQCRREIYVVVEIDALRFPTLHCFRSFDIKYHLGCKPV